MVTMPRFGTLWSPADGQPSPSASGVSVTLSPSVETPTRTIDGFEVSASGRVNPGEEVTADVTAPSDQEYQIEVRDVERNVVGFTGVTSGDDTFTFDTDNMPGGIGDGELDPGTYAVVPLDSGETLDAAPFVVQAYETTTYVQEVLESGDELPVVAELDPLPAADGVSIDAVELVVWRDGNGGTRYTMDRTGTLTYEVTVSNPPDLGFNAETGVLTPVENSDDVDRESVGISDSDGITAATGSLQLQGASTTGGRPQFATPAVATDRVFVGGLGSQVVALPRSNLANNPDPIWAFDRAGSLSDSVPTLGNGLVYVGSGGGVVYALEAGTNEATGNAQWTFPPDGSGTSAITSAPAVASGTVFVGANDGSVYAVDASDGTKQWEATVGGPVYSPLAVEDGRVFLTTADGTLAALDTADGTAVWAETVAGSFGSGGPAVGNGTVYVAADDVYAFDAATGNAAWSSPFEGYGGTVGSTPRLRNGTLYVGSADRSVYALDAGTGSLEWRYETRRGVAATPTVASGTVVVGSLDGSVYAVDGGTGDLLAAESLGTPVRTAAVVDSGTVYLGTRDGSTGGRVVVLDLQ